MKFIVPNVSKIYNEEDDIKSKDDYMIDSMILIKYADYDRNSKALESLKIIAYEFLQINKYLINKDLLGRRNPYELR